MPKKDLSLAVLRRFALARTFFPPTSLRRALARLGFVQADPIRAPARAQDLILRQRVKAYQAGDLERRYQALGIEEDFFINYGFVTREVQALMHPRPALDLPVNGRAPWPEVDQARARAILEYVGARAEVHPREVEKHFAHGRVTNYWGGSSHATTQLLDALHYRGLLRVTRRQKGIRVYRARQAPPAPESEEEGRARLDALLDLVVNLYGPLPGQSLSGYARQLRYGVPQWEREIPSALSRARDRLTHARVGKIDWFWPNGERPRQVAALNLVRLLSPFDPLVHDRRRFELFWGWAYRFEAYTPPEKRKLGYYALPLLWRDRVIGWANLALKAGERVSH